MPFMVGAGGVVQEKNLGHNTAVLAKAMVACNPDSSWRHGKSLEPNRWPPSEFNRRPVS